NCANMTITIGPSIHGIGMCNSLKIYPPINDKISTFSIAFKSSTPSYSSIQSYDYYEETTSFHHYEYWWYSYYDFANSFTCASRSTSSRRRSPQYAEPF